MIHPREHDLVIGTFGRAAWVLDDIRPLRAIAKNASITTSQIELSRPLLNLNSSSLPALALQWTILELAIRRYLTYAICLLRQ